MEIKKKMTGPQEKGETKKFPRLRGMVDRLKNKAMILAVVSMSAFAPIGCGGPTQEPDGGQSDADITTDAGADSDTTTDSGTDGGQSLCAQYPEGHANRRTFNLGVSESVEEGDHVVMLRELMDLGGMRAIFACFDSNFPTDVDFVGLNVGDQETMDVPGVGQTTIELCSTTALECKFQIPGPHEGDENCTATLSSTRAWGSN
jgi:hypothetical protein